MCVAEAVGAVELEIRDEAVVDKATSEAGQETKSTKGFGATFLVDAVPSHQLCAEGVKPVKPSSDTDTALIAVSDGHSGQEVAHAGLKAGEGGKCGRHGGLNSVLADGLAEEIVDHLSDPV